VDTLTHETSQFLKNVPHLRWSNLCKYFAYIFLNWWRLREFIGTVRAFHRKGCLVLAMRNLLGEWCRIQLQKFHYQDPGQKCISLWPLAKIIAKEMFTLFKVSAKTAQTCLFLPGEPNTLLIWKIRLNHITTWDTKNTSCNFGINNRISQFQNNGNVCKKFNLMTVIWFSASYNIVYFKRWGNAAHPDSIIQTILLLTSLILE